MADRQHHLQPRRRPLQRRSEDTRDRILDAAVQVFTAYGYARGTTNRIAAAADISIGSLYQYYPNKDAIVLELVTRHLDTGIAAANRRRHDGLPDSVEGVMQALVATAVDNHRHDPEFLRILIETAPRSRELMDRVTGLQRTAVADMRRLLDAHPDVRVQDKDAAARMVVAAIELLVHQLLAAPDPLDTAVFERELVAMLTRYLTAA